LLELVHKISDADNEMFYFDIRKVNMYDQGKVLQYGL